MIWLAWSCSSFSSETASPVTSTCEQQKVSAPVLLSTRRYVVRKGNTMLHRNESDIIHNIAGAISWNIRQIEDRLGIDIEQNYYEDPGQLMGVATNGKDDLRMLRSALMISTGGVMALVLIFILQRKISPLVYSKPCMKPQTEAADTPEQQPDRPSGDVTHDEGYMNLSVGYLDWIGKVWRTTPEEEVLHAGLDGFAFLEFRRLNFRILLCIGPILSSVLLPIHYVANSDLGKSDILGRLDIGNELKPSWMLWVHASMVWVVIAISSWHIVHAQYEFTERRYQWLKEIPVPRATTLMVRNIPHAYRTDATLKTFFANLFGKDKVDRAYIVRHTGRLPAQVQALTDAKLELAHAKKRWEAEDRPQWLSGEVDQLQKRADQLTLDTVQAQSRLQEAVERGDPTVCSSSGFVTFDSQLSQRLAFREQCTREVAEFKMSIPPDPDDVRYTNVAQEDGVNSESWNWLYRFFMLVVFTLWIPFVMVLSSWTTFGALQEMFPALKDFIKDHKWMDQLLSGVFATIVLKIFLAFLPSVMYFFITSFASVKSGSAVQIKVQIWYSAFLLIFVLLVTSLGRGLTITLVAIAQQPGTIFSLLAGYLPSASHFYFQYVILGWIALFTELLRSANFWKYHIFRIIFSMSPEEAKENSEPEDPACYGLGARMAASLLTSAITFMFCSCSPLIIVFSLIYFGLGQFTYGYLVVFAESKKADTGGFLWLQSLSQLFWVLAIYVLLMTGVLQMLSQHDYWIGPPLTALSSLFILFWARRKVNNLAFDALPLDEVVRTGRERKTSMKASAQQYVQAECIPVY